MVDRGRQFHHESDGLLEAIDQLREALVGFKKAFAAQCRRMERGTSGVEAMESVNAAGVRQQLADAMDEFEAARYRTRLAFITLALDEGASLSDVARAMGVSRQLVSRLARDIGAV